MTSNAATSTSESQPTPSSALSEGTTIGGRYRVVRRVLPSLYHAHDEQRDRPVWLRLCPGSRLLVEFQGENLQRLKQAGALGSGVSKVLKVGKVDSDCFVASEFAEGEVLDDALSRRLFSTKEAVGVIRSVVEVLQRGHRQGLVHRGICPESLILSNNQAHLLEYGIDVRWKIYAPDRSAYAYRAPEQVDEDEPNIGPLTDVYSIGVLAYELLTGRVPFKGQERETLEERILFQEPTPIRELAPEVPHPLAEVVERCLAKEPQRRFSSLAELDERLEHCSLEVPSPKRAVPRRARKFSIRTAVSVAMLIALIPIAYFVVPQKIEQFQATEQPDDATAEANYTTSEDGIKTSTDGQRLYGYGDLEESTGLSMAEIVQWLQDEAIPPPSERYFEQGRPLWEGKAIEPWLAIFAQSSKDELTRFVLDAQTGPDPTPSSMRAGGIDLLSQIELSQDVLSPHWTREGNTLVCRSAEGRNAILRLPYDAPAEYTIEFKVHSIDPKRDGALLIGLANDQVGFGAHLKGGASQSWLLDYGPNPASPENGMHKRRMPVRFFQSKQPVVISCTVGSDSVRISENGHLKLEWQGDFATLSRQRCWATQNQPDQRTMFLCSWGGFAFSEIRVHPKSAEPRSPLGNED